jgi:hypothetical protein
VKIFGVFQPTPLKIGICPDNQKFQANSVPLPNLIRWTVLVEKQLNLSPPIRKKKQKNIQAAEV